MRAISDSVHDDFEALLEAHRRIVFKVAATYAREPEDRADLAQEIAAQLWRAFPNYDPERATFSTWAYRIALNVAISFFRNSSVRNRRNVPFDEQRHDRLAPDAHGDDDPRLAALNAFIERLDPLNRALLLLYLEERSYREISQILGITETNVASKLSRLKQRIRNEIKD